MGRPVFLFLRTAYYAAPNCNSLCSSGSGTPKADGTQNCSCFEGNTFTLSAAKVTYKFFTNKIYYGYSDGNVTKGTGGALSPNAFRGQTISRISSMSSGTDLYFASLPSDTSDITMKINGQTITLVRDTSSSKARWKTSTGDLWTTGTVSFTLK